MNENPVSENKTPLRLALVAHGCQPDSSSENRTGWEWAEGLAAAGADVTIFTDSTNSDAIEAYQGDVRRMTFATASASAEIGCRITWQ